MTEIIHVQPRRDLRREFAGWAVAQTPKIRTVSAQAFGVPADLFTDMPEDLLRGALVNGHPYVSPLDHEEETEPAGPGAPELLGVATLDGLREAVPGQPLPEVPASAYGPDSVPLPVDFAPLEDAPEEVTWPEGTTPPHPAAVAAAMTAVLTAVDLAAANHTGDTGDTAGDTGGDGLARGEDTDGDTPPVTSEDTPAGTGDTAGDSGAGGPVNPYACDLCPRTFESERGRDSHRRQAHREG